jgi:hypothetical protein
MLRRARAWRLDLHQLAPRARATARHRSTLAAAVDPSSACYGNRYIRGLSGGCGTT